MGFADEVLDYSPYYERKDQAFQVDLLYVRGDKVITVCEIKYHNKEIGTSIIPEFEQKLKLLPIPKGYSVERALISLYGPDQSLIQAQYFHHCVSLDDIL